VQRIINNGGARKMGRLAIPYERSRLHVYIPKAQSDELRKTADLIDKNITDCVIEALQYWLAAQRKMGVK
jgi:hypothetical protein